MLLYKMVVGHKWSPKTSHEGLCWLLNGSNEAKSTLWMFGLLKQAAALNIASPDTCQCLKLPFNPFTSSWIYRCYNQPQVGRLKYMLETSTTVVWLYAGGVSLILPDVQFGTVSQNLVSFYELWYHKSYKTSLRQLLYTLCSSYQLQ